MGQAEMDCGVQVEVSKALLLVGVVVGVVMVVVVVRQLQALEMREEPQVAIPLGAVLVDVFRYCLQKLADVDS